MNMEFMDKFKSKITASVFNKQIWLFQGILQEGAVYLLSNATIEISNVKYGKAVNQYSLTIDDGTKVNKIDDDGSIPLDEEKKE